MEAINYHIPLYFPVITIWLEILLNRVCIVTDREFLVGKKSVTLSFWGPDNGLYWLWNIFMELSDVIKRRMATKAKGQVQLCYFDSETLLACSVSSLLIHTRWIRMDTCTLVCEASREEKKNHCSWGELCWVLSFVGLLKPNDWTEKWASFASFKYNLPVGDIRPYFYSVAAGIQKEQRNLLKYSFGARGRRNQSHKNRALNRVPLNWLLELHRNGHSTAGRAPRGHTVFTRIQFRLNKVMLHFQPALTTAFLKWHLIPSCLQRVPTVIQQETLWKKGMCRKRGGLFDWRCGGAYMGFKRQGCSISILPPQTTISEYL